MKPLQKSLGSAKLTTLRCLICQEKVTTEIDSLKAEIKSEICHRFFTLSSRYLNFECDYVRKGDGNKGSTLNNRNSNFDKNGAKICDSCFPFAETFCLVYGQWQRLNLELNWTLNVIADLMKVKVNSFHKTKSTEPAKQNNFDYFSTNLITKARPVPKSAKYRASFVSKVKVANRKLPQLRIPRISDSKPFKENEKFAAFMDVDDIEDVSSPFSNDNLGTGNDTPKPINVDNSKTSSGIFRRSNYVFILPKPSLAAVAPPEERHTPQVTQTPALKKDTPKSVGKFKCDYCKKRFQSKSAVKLHRNKAHGEPVRINIHNCSYCGKQFDLNETAEAQLHYNEHIKERERNCASVFLQSFIRAKAREKEVEGEIKEDDFAVPTSILQITPDIKEDVTSQVDIKPEIEMLSAVPAKCEEEDMKITPDLETDEFETSPVFPVKQEVITDGEEILNY